MDVNVQLVGSAAALITSLCWVPQMVKMFCSALSIVFLKIRYG